MWVGAPDAAGGRVAAGGCVVAGAEPDGPAGPGALVPALGVLEAGAWVAVLLQLEIIKLVIAAIVNRAAFRKW